jgi:hypothetical protein
MYTASGTVWRYSHFVVFGTLMLKHLLTTAGASGVQIQVAVLLSGIEQLIVFYILNIWRS